MRASLLFCSLLLAWPALLRAQEVRLIPRDRAPLASAPSAVALTRSALAESSPFGAITATDPRLRADAAPCRAGSLNNVTGSRLEPCTGNSHLLSRFVETPEPQPLTGTQKALLAAHNVIQPGSLATLGGSSAYTILTDAHTAYGPGFAGLGRSFGIGLVQDATGQFFGTWAIPALAGQDSRYHRMPHATVPRRILHAVEHTVIAQHDDGRPMLNVATLGTYPISAEISNLYVPGVHGNGPSTVKRVLSGYATDPIDTLITEFLPDFARHVQIHILFTQQILNQLSSEPYPGNP
jgi:hypothetical protein